MTRLLTAEQVCERYGIPGPRTVRTMRQQGLAFVRLGKACLFDAADVESFIAARKEQTCRARTEAPGCTGLQSGEPITLSGMSAAQSASVQQARLIAAKLKRP